MGTFYRSRHELTYVYKNGTAQHMNNFELGQHGRYRSNVWEYRGVNTRKADRHDELSLHPTVKPVPMVADAIKDVSPRGGIVLDPFGGSGPDAVPMSWKLIRPTAIGSSIAGSNTPRTRQY